MHAFTSLAGSWLGVCDFRLMPTDDFVSGDSSAAASTEASGQGWSLRYTWHHPDDGEQHGALLVGSPIDDGTVHASWIDSWHQSPELRLLTGRFDDDVLRLSMEYSGWGWIIDIVGSDSRLGMQMSNVIPADSGHAHPGPYTVMQARWDRVVAR